MNLRHPSQTPPLRWGHKTPDLERRIAELLTWVRPAGQPYDDALLQGADIDKTLSRWMLRDNSEITLQRARLLMLDDRIAGGYIALSGTELRTARQADLLDVARHMGEGSYAMLRERVERLRELFAPLEDNDFVITRLGLHPDHRGRGLCHALIEDYLRRGRQGGFRRARVDVPETHRAGLDLCRAYGFDTAYRGKSNDGKLKYLTMVRDLNDH
ncbi:GNAT family N-acetyltransferase [Lujinxingia vulgaris]|uniref:GNAT family N-acetyltransferase n=1 Tax=Lujinxingia vulgaris TaxID=2600176 RepID=A0A5C6X5X5_9DELT|nr:GNAT family N-acetyltransferase [Lujinxingia vulgaris]TXD36570.1 GNAT family N-acetyltransferase [Lujinxingia vulgaris]